MYYIEYNVYKEIVNIIGNAPIESGGILGIKYSTICSFYYDSFAKNSFSSYTPSVDMLNHIIKEWLKEEIKFVGIVHSHPNGQNLPSDEDGKYAKKILEINKDLSFLIFPIVTKNDNEIYISFYKYDTKFSHIKLTIKNRHC